MSVPDAATTMQTMAGKDLAALCDMLDSAQFADEIFGFHAQQSIDKSLKAVDYSCRRSFRLYS